MTRALGLNAGDFIHTIRIGGYEREWIRRRAFVPEPPMGTLRGSKAFNRKAGEEGVSRRRLQGPPGLDFIHPSAGSRPAP